MFDKIQQFFHHGDESVKRANEHYNKQANPLKEMVVDLANIISKEVDSNDKIDPAQDFELLVRNPSEVSDQITHLRGVHRDDLSAMLEKVREWSEDKSPTELPLLPREIEALQQIANAIERKELVIKQGNQFIAHEQSAVYNAILNHTASIEKADQLGVQKIIGRKGGIDGEIVLGDISEREQLEGVYDLYSEDDDKEIRQTFGKKSRFSDEEFIREVEDFDLSDEQVAHIRKNRASFSKSYKQDEENFTSKYQDLGQALKAQYDQTIKNLEENSKDKSSKNQTGTSDPLERLNESVNTPHKAGQLRIAEETRRASKSIFLEGERAKDQLADRERQRELKLEKDLDDKFDRIHQEYQSFETKHEDDPPKKAT